MHWTSSGASWALMGLHASSDYIDPDLAITRRIESDGKNI